MNFVANLDQSASAAPVQAPELENIPLDDEVAKLRFASVRVMAATSIRPGGDDTVSDRTKARLAQGGRMGDARTAMTCA